MAELRFRARVDHLLPVQLPNLRLPNLPRRLPNLTRPRVPVSLATFFDRLALPTWFRALPTWFRDVDEAVPDKDTRKFIGASIQARTKVLKLWQEVYGMAKSVLIYSGSAIIGYLFFYVTKNGDQQRIKSSRPTYLDMVSFGSICIGVTGIGAAFFLFVINWNAVTLATAASRRYRTGKLRDLQNHVKANISNSKEVPTQVRELALPVYASRWFYVVFCLIVLVGTVVCSIYQLRELCALSYFENLKEDLSHVDHPYTTFGCDHPYTTFGCAGLE